MKRLWCLAAVYTSKHQGVCEAITTIETVLMILWMMYCPLRWLKIKSPYHHCATTFAAHKRFGGPTGSCGPLPKGERAPHPRGAMSRDVWASAVTENKKPSPPLSSLRKGGWVEARHTCRVEVQASSLA